MPSHDPARGRAEADHPADGGRRGRSYGRGLEWCLRHVARSPTTSIRSSAIRLASAIIEALGDARTCSVFPGATSAIAPTNWTKNYRCPDVAVFLPGNPAEDRETHWLGGPDFAVEIVSRDDRSRKKFDFYAKVGVRELLLVDR